ncbi:MAG: AAA family ATPase [Bacteroidales bacterium]|nr:AAA family ATPase [Bacteroidales bacterium]MDD3961549.1 shikimate kinase [Bacteroidales bacterium]MDY0285041.1 shikimate kinase [Bacteroidales bacterium]
MKLFVIGYMGSGKTTLAKKLAKKLDLPFNDLDQCLEQKLKQNIPAIFSEKGELFFRKQERKLLHTFNNHTPEIISTGGGTPCYYDNMEWMKAHGVTLYLKLPPKALAKRLQESKIQRPLLENIGNKIAYIEQHLSEREVFYNQAEIIVSGLSVDINALTALLRTRFSMQ